MSQTTTPPNAPEVDVLAVLNLHCDCDSSEIAAGHYRAGLLCEKSAAVAALLTREAALVAEVDLLRRVQASMATEGVALVAERDALAAFDRLLAADLEYDAALAEKWNMPSPVDDQTIDRVVARFKAATDERAAAIRACKELRRS